MARSRHSKKEVETALKAAEAVGWNVIPKDSGHSWGVARCAAVPGCYVAIFSTPRNPGNHAKQIARAVAHCPHPTDDEEPTP